LNKIQTEQLIEWSQKLHVLRMFFNMQKRDFLRVLSCYTRFLDSNIVTQPTDCYTWIIKAIDTGNKLQGGTITLTL